MIQLLHLNIDLVSKEEFQKELSKLPIILQNEILAYRNFTDQQLKLYGRKLVQLYCDNNGIDFNWDLWKTTPFGKPEIPGIQFNISHSGSFVIAAFSENEIGVDIEEIKAIDTEEMSLYFHQDEKKHLKKALEPVSEFYRIWTRKEAYLKAVGTGITEGLNNENCLEESLLNTNKKTYFIQSVPFLKNYTLAVCHTSMNGVLLPSQIEQIFPSKSFK